MYVPIVVEQGERGERSYDIYSRLLKDRIIFKDRYFRRTALYHYDLRNAVFPHNNARMLGTRFGKWRTWFPITFGCRPIGN